MDRIEHERRNGEPWNYDGEPVEEEQEGQLQDNNNSNNTQSELWFDSYFSDFQNNSSSEDSEMVFSRIRESVAWYGSILTAWSIPLNVLLLAVLFLGLKRTRSRYSPYRWLMVNFTIVQLVMSSFVIPLNIITDRRGSWVFGSDLCRVWLLAQLVLAANTFWSLFAMTFDRFLSNVARMTYIGWSGGRFSSLVVVSGSWVISGLVLVPSLIIRSDFVLDEGFCATSITPDQSLFITLAIIGVPGSLTLLVFGAMFVAKLRLHGNGYKEAVDDVSCRHGNNRSSVTTSDDYDDDSSGGSDAIVGCGSDVIGLMTVCVVCVVTWAPFYVISVVIAFCGGRVCVDPGLWSVTIWAGYSTSGLAPMFWFIDPWMRNQIRTKPGKTPPGGVGGVGGGGCDSSSEFSFQTNSSKRSLTRAL